MAKKKTTKKKVSKKKQTAKKQTAKKKTAKKKATKKKATKKKATKKKATKKKVAKKKPAARKIISMAEQLFQSDSLPTTRSITISKSKLAPIRVEYFATPQEMRRDHAKRKEELEKQRLIAEKVLETVIRPAIHEGKFGDVTGCCVCFRRKQGRIVLPLSYVVQVAVESKLLEKTLVNRDIDCVPKQVDGIEVKVVESRPRTGRRTSGDIDPPDVVMPNGKFEDKDLVELRENEVTLKETDLIGGLPAEEMNTGNWGTMGITFKRGRKFYAMVNAHFADKKGTVFVQPPFRPDDLTDWNIGSVIESYEGTEDPDIDDAHVDAALIELNTARSTVNAVIEFGGEDLLFANRKLNQEQDVFAKVFKYGARTREKREGFINVANYGDLRIDGVLLGSVIQAQRAVTGSFSGVGDSGCLLIAPVRAGNRYRLLAVGICFADDTAKPDFVYACQMKSVIDRFDFDFPDRLLLDEWSYPDP